MKLLNTLLLLAGSSAALHSYAQGNTVPAAAGNEKATCTECSCAATQAPAGIMTDHVMQKGKWMAAYYYMNTTTEGNRNGSTMLSNDDVYRHYSMATDKMVMQMHMAMVMYGVTDRMTVMAMGGFMTSAMNMNMSNTSICCTGPNSTMNCLSSGLTDTRLSALYNFSGTPLRHITGSLGISLPTGSTRCTGTTMLGDNQRLPYDMQTGTGSFGLLPGITYIRRYGLFSIGADAGADVKLNNNSLGYKAGNTYHAGGWGGYRFLPCLSASIRAEGVTAGKITGQDAGISYTVYEQNDPTTCTDNYGGTWVNVYAGLNYHPLQPALSRFTILAEYGIPVYQDLNGTQASLHASLVAGVQYSF